jgi:hypothetical protein
VLCAYCEDEIAGRPIRRHGDYYCSIECADRAEDLALAESEEDDYYSEEVPEGVYEDDDDEH